MLFFMHLLIQFAHTNLPRINQPSSISVQMILNIHLKQKKEILTINFEAFLHI